MDTYMLLQCSVDNGCGMLLNNCIWTIYKSWHGHPFTKAENVMYFMFACTGYGIGIALMIHVCHNVFGGAINKFSELG